MMKKCLNCQGPVPPAKNNPHRKFCSDKCRKAHGHIRRKKAKAEAQRLEEIRRRKAEEAARKEDRDAKKHEATVRSLESFMRARDARMKKHRTSAPRHYPAE